MSGLLPRDHFSSGRSSSGSSSYYYPTADRIPRQSDYGDQLPRQGDYNDHLRHSSHADTRDYGPSTPSRLRQSQTAYDDPLSSSRSSFSTVRPSSRSFSYSTHAEPTRRLFPEPSYHTPPRLPSYHSSQASQRSALSFDPYREPSDASSSTWGPRSSLSSDPFGGFLPGRRPSQMLFPERRTSHRSSPERRSPGISVPNERRPSQLYANERRPSSYLPDRRPSYFQRSHPDRDPFGPQ